jgi:hypothetical protein
MGTKAKPSEEKYIQTKPHCRFQCENFKTKYIPRTKRPQKLRIGYLSSESRNFLRQF